MLKLTKKGDKYWLFEDSEIGLFSPSKFTINLELNEIVIVYENGLKSKRYNVIDCEIYDLGSLVPFTTSSGNDFMAKLEELNCPCFQKNENIYYISGGSWYELTDFNLLPDATTPLAGTEEIPIVQSGVTKKVAVSEIGVATTPNLQQVTDIGNSTTNYIQIESTDLILSLYPNAVFCVNILNNMACELTADLLKFNNGVGYSQIITRNQTQNTDFYFEDEGGSKSIATREWVNDNINGEIVNITTPSPNHTGTSVETNITSYNFVIPANTLSNGDTLRIENMLWEKIGILNTSYCRLKLSNTNNFATANQVAIFFNSTANIYMRACRTFNINSGLLRGVSFTANGIFNDFTLTNLGFSTLALDFTQPIYGFISLQLTNPADIVLMRELKIRKI